MSLLVSFDDGVDREAMRSELSALPGVAAYSDARALYETARGMMSLFFAFVGVMLVFGSLMAVALIVNTATVNAAERSPELAAMEVNGAAPGQLGRLLAGESLLLTLLSIAPGLVVGYYVSAGLMDSFSSDLFDFGLELRGTTMMWTVFVILVAWGIGQWPAWRTIRSLDIAQVVRERAQ
jgi:putative ABC transport system permease protein